MARIRGTEGDDTLTGTLSGDTIWGFGGNDLILADPTVFDFIGGNDTVHGGDGHDVIYTFGGRDTVHAGDGNDQVFTADGDDVIYAGAGDDSDVQSGRGKDLVYGGDGNDDLKGGEGNDKLYGEGGNDSLAGGSDNDLLVGGEGADELGGRTGDDTLDLSELLSSTDTVIFQEDDVGNGVDTIVGFDPNAPSDGGDLIDAREIAGQGLHLVQSGADVRIAAGSTTVAVVKDVTVDQLNDNILGVDLDALVASTADGSGEVVT